MILPETFIILDTEFTSWEGSQERNWSEEFEHRELVQISALKIENMILMDCINLYVKPKINTKLSDYFINLTGIENRTIRLLGLDFENAISKLYDLSENLPIFSYGNDYKIIYENLKLNNNTNKKYYDWSINWFDIRVIFKHYQINTTNYSSGTIYKITGKKYKHKVHDALWDCKSIYYALNYLIKQNKH